MFVESIKHKNLHLYDDEAPLPSTTTGHTSAPSVALKEPPLVVEPTERAGILSKRYEHINLLNLKFFILLVLQPVSFPLTISINELHQSNTMGVGTVEIVWHLDNEDTVRDSIVVD